MEVREGDFEHVNCI